MHNRSESKKSTKTKSITFVTHLHLCVARGTIEESCLPLHFECNGLRASCKRDRVIVKQNAITKVMQTIGVLHESNGGTSCGGVHRVERNTISCGITTLGEEK